MPTPLRDMYLREESHFWGPFDLEPLLQEQLNDPETLSVLSEAPSLSLGQSEETAPEVMGQRTGGDTLGPAQREWTLDAEESFRQNRNRHFDSATVASVVASPALAAEARKALGLPEEAELAVWRSMLWWSYPGDSGLPFHFDAYSTVLRGSGGVSLTAYIGVTEVTEKNGMKALRWSTPDMFFGAHPDIYGNALLQVPQQVEDSAEPAMLLPGQFVLFDQDCVHSSIANRDPLGSPPRVALALRIIPASTGVHHHAFQPGQQSVPLGTAKPAKTNLPEAPQSDDVSVKFPSGACVLVTVPKTPGGRHTAQRVACSAVQQRAARVILLGNCELDQLEQLACCARAAAGPATRVTVVHQPASEDGCEAVVGPLTQVLEQRVPAGAVVHLVCTLSTEELVGEAAQAAVQRGGWILELCDPQ
eukprot:TRINITY_DN10702_c0_g1_i3.p1 TRINITY_DN10702_c0_g1~~TRINITY_DN10702_c0_g1_i3.p1  ORF type:complete len:419 (+),score=104.29 TRINITY_DN10702_c0_g1_i3:200-1456(+)